MSRNVPRVPVGTLLTFAALVSVLSARQTSTTTETKKFEVVAVNGNALVVREDAGTMEYIVPDTFRFTTGGKSLSVHELTARHEGHGHNHHDDHRDASDGDGSQAGDGDASDWQFGGRARRERHPHVLGRRHQQAAHYDSSRWQAGRAWRSARGRSADGDRRHRGAAKGDDRAGREGIDRGSECSRSVCTVPDVSSAAGSGTEAGASRDLASDCLSSRVDADDTRDSARDSRREQQWIDVGRRGAGSRDRYRLPDLAEERLLRLAGNWGQISIFYRRQV